MDDALIWSVRTFIFETFVATTRAPQLTEIMQAFNLSTEQATDVLFALHEKHAIFLDPGTIDIRIANPFSAIPTPFLVDVNDKTYTANCAWDCFGVVAALHAKEALIHSVCTQSAMPVHMEIHQGQVVPTSTLIHVLVPFQQWYDDMVFT